MDFHETVDGKRFFEGQLPKLISALEAIAKALQKEPAVKQSRTAPPVLLSVDVPGDFLRALYYGEIDPSGLPNSPEHEELTQRISEYQDELQADVGPKLWTRIDGYRTLLDDRGSVERLQAFESGYRCAMQMIAAGLTQPQANAQSEEGGHV